jgi:putative secretion ATPase (PEP-CTERM system associated)
MFESFFGFSANPFQLNPDPSFYFESKSHSSAFAHLKYGVYQGEGFIVITGEVGAGKTTLVRTLLQQIDPAKIVAGQIVSTQLDSDDLLRSVAAAFGLPIKSAAKAQLIATIEAFLVSIAAEGRRALLVVDEAQNLSAGALEELRMLSNFQLGPHALLHSFLIGQPELRTMLRAPSLLQLRQRIISSYHLGPLGPGETRKYVEHRLARVGWTDDPAIEDQVFDLIYEGSRGIPRIINNLCSRLLLSACLKESHAIGAADASEALSEFLAETQFGGGTDAVPAPPGPSEVHASVEGAAHGSVVRPFALASLTARLDRIEKMLTVTLELLRSQSGHQSEPKPRGPGRGGVGRSSVAGNT